MAAALTAGVVVPRPLADIAGDEPVTREILILMNPIHSDIAIPLDDEAVAAFAFASAGGVPISHPEARYLVAGWGGRDFYLETPTWADLKAGPLIKGLTVDRSVMHLDVIGEVPEGELDGVLRLRLGEERFRRLVARVEKGFARDAAGAPILIAGRSYGFTDRFYEAEGWFNAIVGCNVWTSAVLREAGIRTGIWTPLPQLLALSIRLHN